MDLFRISIDCCNLMNSITETPCIDYDTFFPMKSYGEFFGIRLNINVIKCMYDFYDVFDSLNDFIKLWLLF